MIKKYLLLLPLCFVSSIKAQIIDIPDANFKTKLLEANEINNTANFLDGKSMKIDLNGNGEIEITEALKITELSIDNSNILSIEGIKKFSNLKYLSFHNNKVSVFNLNGMNLTFLECSNNQITDLDIAGLPNLISLGCADNLLTSLDLSNQKANTFLSLNCSGNKLKDLQIQQFINIKSLDCSENELTSLNITAFSTLLNLDYSNNKIPEYDVTNFLNLEDFRCVNTGTSNLDLTGLTKLRNIVCDENNLTNLNVSHLFTLERLFCSNNKIVALDLKNLNKLQYLEVDNNQLEVLDLENLTELLHVHISNNNIKTLNINNASDLQEFFVTQNPFLESLYLKNGSLEPLIIVSENPNLKYICADEDQITKIENSLNESGQVNFTVNSYCSFSPSGESFTIQGYSRNDSDNNGCDTNDIPASFLKFEISNGVKTGRLIANETGNYAIKVPAGSYTIIPVFENPDYFSVSPPSLQVEFPVVTSPFLQDFCITAVDSHKDLEITLLPVTVARPGFTADYKIVFKNKGNVAQSGNINLLFKDSVLDLESSAPVVSGQTFNNLSWNFTNLKPFETREIALTFRTNSPIQTPAVVNGDILNYTAIVNSSEMDEKPQDNTFTLNQTVVGSYDPNDKTCLEGDVITPALIGQYVHYMIRFENTGSYAAENIVVKDMIDLSKFDIATLTPSSASHSYSTKISDVNKVEFIFENINLPFDDASNDGYIAFKIKTLPTLSVGDSFTNEANIYFDYNFPILTNTAKSTFNTLSTQDFEFSNYFNIYPVPANNKLNLVTKHEIKIQSLSVYDVLGQLLIAVTDAKSVSDIDVSKLRSGNYILKIRTDKGDSGIKFNKI